MVPAFLLGAIDGADLSDLVSNLIAVLSLRIGYMKHTTVFRAPPHIIDALKLKAIEVSAMKGRRVSMNDILLKCVEKAGIGLDAPSQPNKAARGGTHG